MSVEKSDNLLEFHIEGDDICLEITNQSSDDMNFSLIPLENNEVPLSLKLTNENFQSIYEPLVNYSPKKPLQPGQTDKICLTARSKEILDSQATGLLKITDNLGNQFYLNVWAKGLKE